MAPENEARAGEAAKDARIDKVAQWLLTACAGVALAYAGAAFTGLTAEVKGLRDDLAKIDKRLAVLESGDSASRIRALEQAATEERGFRVEVDRRLGALEGRSR